MFQIIFLLIGFFLLFLGGEFLVRGSVSLALKIKISTLVVGMTVVAFATSAPELFVSLRAVAEGSSNIALGNAIGSNIANLCLVLSFTAIIFRVRISESILSLNYPMMFVSSLLLGGVLYFFNGIPSIAGVFFVILLFLFIWLLINTSRKKYLKSPVHEHEILDKAPGNSLLKSILLLIAGIFSLRYGADFLVESAKYLAESFGVSDRVIAVTIIAVGTSLPELATSIIAAFKREENLAIGNLIGSNIFNILAVLGVTACLKEINLDDTAIFSFDYLWMMIITLLVGSFIYIFSKKEISRVEGASLLLLYLLYMYLTLV